MRSTEYLYPTANNLPNYPAVLYLSVSYSTPNAPSMPKLTDVKFSYLGRCTTPGNKLTGGKRKKERDEREENPKCTSLQRQSGGYLICASFSQYC